ncbi:MAG: DNA primase [Ruminococcus sp.]|nr:DNA primase [Ruminococcus sp.]
MYELIPEELKALPNWVCWRAEPNPKSHSGVSKKPINPRTGGLAMSNNPQTWADFETAVRVSADFAGIGFMFDGSGYFGVDLDGCTDAMQAYFSGNHDNIIGDFVESLQSYTEFSQSNTGIHIICKGRLPEGGRRRGSVEMYDSGRFFVMTGNCCTRFVDVADGTEQIRRLHGKYISGSTSSHAPDPPPTFTEGVGRHLISGDPPPQGIITKAMQSANGEKFAKLYGGDFSDFPSQSEADMAFCSMLAFWCGGDTELMDRIYRGSGLMRDKWDRRQSGSTYGKLTLKKAAAECTEFYTPKMQDDYAISIRKNSETVKPGTSGKMYTFDDTGNAQRMHDAFGEDLRYSYVEKKWLYYKEGKWHYDNLGFHRRLADAVVTEMEQELELYSDDPDMEKAFRKHLKKSRSFTGKTNMLREAEHYAPILPSMLDKNKTIIGCKNGIVDLRSGQLLPHDRNAFLTKQAAAVYDPDAPEPALWLQFLHDIFDGDMALIQYVQKCVGYSLAGTTSEQCAFFLYGAGRNGKSTFLEIIRSIMGDYATNIQPQTIMINPKSGSAPTSDIARLKGARLVTSVEPNEGMRLDEGLLKQLTGDDVVTARKMFSEEFEFKPEFKLWMATNHKPTIRGTDTGIWRRIHLIPFEVQIPESKVDRHLKYKLAKEAAGIFKWAVDGCLLWQREGLSKPKKVLDAIKEYRHEMDVLSAFMDANCETGDGSVKASQLYAVYARWAEENNEYKMSNTKFGAEMAKRFEKVKKMDGWYYVGIRLHTSADDYSVSIG